MKLLLAAGSVGSLLWLIWALTGLPERSVPREPFILYTFFHLVFVVTAYWSLLRLDVRSTQYQEFYLLPAVPVVWLAGELAVRLCRPYPLWLALLGGGVLSCIVAVVIRHYILEASGEAQLTWLQIFLLFQAGTFLACGLALLVSLAAPVETADSLLRLGFGVFWLFQGAFAFSLLIGLHKDRLAWMGWNNWLPATAAILIFCFLAWSLGRQMEGSRAAARIVGVEAAEAAE